MPHITVHFTTVVHARVSHLFGKMLYIFLEQSHLFYQVVLFLLLLLQVLQVSIGGISSREIIRRKIALTCTYSAAPFLLHVVR